MRNLLLLVGMGLAGFAGMAPAGRADEFGLLPPACAPGYKVVEQICYREVVKKVCRTVPDVEKTVKWVYNCETEEFCLPRPGHAGAACGDCAGCEKPRTRRLLVKRQVVTECPTTRCVVDFVTEQVPYVVYKQVPCIPPPVAAAPVRSNAGPALLPASLGAPIPADSTAAQAER